MKKSLVFGATLLAAVSAAAMARAADDELVLVT